MSHPPLKPIPFGYKMVSPRDVIHRLSCLQSVCIHLPRHDCELAMSEIKRMCELFAIEYRDYSLREPSSFLQVYCGAYPDWDVCKLCQRDHCDIKLD